MMGRIQGEKQMKVSLHGMWMADMAKMIPCGCPVHLMQIIATWIRTDLRQSRKWGWKYWRRLFSHHVMSASDRHLRKQDMLKTFCSLNRLNIDKNVKNW